MAWLRCRALFKRCTYVMGQWSYSTHSSTPYIFNGIIELLLQGYGRVVRCKVMSWPMREEAENCKTWDGVELHGRSGGQESQGVHEAHESEGADTLIP